MRVYEAKLSYEATLFEVGPHSLSTPDVVYAYMKDVLEVHPMHEVFYVILLSRKNRPLGRIAITSGTATAALAHPREVFRPAIVGGATAIICAHNHPSGNLKPSEADRQLTNKLTQAGKSLDISVLDHLIIIADEYFSFADEGLL